MRANLIGETVCRFGCLYIYLQSNFTWGGHNIRVC